MKVTIAPGLARADSTIGHECRDTTMRNSMQPVGLLVGQALLAYIFVLAGVHKIGRFSDTASHRKTGVTSQFLLIYSLLTRA